MKISKLQRIKLRLLLAKFRLFITWFFFGKRKEYDSGALAAFKKVYREMLVQKENIHWRKLIWDQAIQIGGAPKEIDFYEAFVGPKERDISLDEIACYAEPPCINTIRQLEECREIWRYMYGDEPIAQWRINVWEGIIKQPEKSHIEIFKLFERKSERITIFTKIKKLWQRVKHTQALKLSKKR